MLQYPCSLLCGGVKLRQKFLRLRRVLLDFVAVCTQRGNVADDGIVDFQQLEAVGQAAAVFFRLARHIGQGAGEGGGFVVADAACHAVLHVVADAVVQFVQHGGQIARVAADGGGRGFVQRQVFPVRPQEIHGAACNQAAGKRIQHARNEKAGHVHAHDGKAHNGLNGNEKGGKAVFVGAEQEKQGNADGSNGQFGFQIQVEGGQGGADQHAGYSAQNALNQAFFGGGIVGLANEDGGE